MKFYMITIVLFSLAICLLHLSAATMPKVNDDDIWVAVIDSNRDLCTLQAELFELQVLQWKANIIEKSGGVKPVHTAILLQVLLQINSKIRLAEVELEDLRE